MALFLAVMTVLTALQVLLRYVFNSGLIWSLEATTYCFAWLVLVGMSYCVRTRTHIALDLLVKRFPDRARRKIGLLAVGVSVAYSLLMLYGSGMFIQRLFELGHRAHDLPVARWLLTIILPVGFALLTLRLVQAGMGIRSGKVTGLGLSDHDPESFRAAQSTHGADGGGSADR